MAIETATYISGLVSANPPATDPVGQADDHIRLIKGVLKSTFPNLNAACNATPLQLNGYFVPQGAIIMWSGSTAPTGWALCNGGTFAKADGTGSVVVPNLSDRFILAKGTTYPTVGATGGAFTVTPSVSVSNSSYVLTANDIPSHTHTATVTELPHTHTLTDAGHTHTYTAGGAATGLVGASGGPMAVNISAPAAGSTTASQVTGITLGTTSTGITVANSNTGGGGGHTHTATVTSAAVQAIPPYYVLAFIYKL